MTVGSIVIKNDPVKKPEVFLITLSPIENRRSRLEGVFSSYRPTDRAEGNHWGASFTLHAREEILKEFFEFGLGRTVEVWGYGLEPDFEGWVDEMSFLLPPDRFRKSLRGMANKIFMRADTDGDETAERTTPIQNTESQSEFGIFERVLSGGVLFDSAVADQAVQQWIDLKAYPMPEADFGGVFGRGAMATLDVYVRGYISSLERQVYNQTSETDSQSATSEVGAILTSVGEFVGAQELGTNTTRILKEHDIDRRGFDILMDIPRLGDVENNRWLIQFIGRDAVSVTSRIARFKQAAPVIPPTE